MRVCGLPADRHSRAFKICRRKQTTTITAGNNERQKESGRWVQEVDKNIETKKKALQKQMLLAVFYALASSDNWKLIFRSLKMFPGFEDTSWHQDPPLHPGATNQKLWDIGKLKMQTNKKETHPVNVIWKLTFTSCTYPTVSTLWLLHTVRFHPSQTKDEQSWE